MTHTLHDVTKFLLGESPLDGVWYSEPHPTERGAFWWRKHLRSALAQQGEQQPTVEAAHELGAKGAEPTEAERLLFEAWMRGHCWALSAIWDGSTYRGTAEHGNYVCLRAMNTRQIWAAWRDRAALAAAPAAQPDAIGVVLVYEDGGCSGVCGNTVGADGSGLFAVVFYGATDAADEAARAYLKKLQAQRRHVSNVQLVVNTEGFCGYPVKAEFVAATKQFAPAAQPDRTGMTYYKNDKCKAESAASPDCICWTPAAPAAQLDARKVIEQMVGALKWCVEQGGGPVCEHESGGAVCFCKENAAIQAGKQWLEENK